MTQMTSRRSKEKLWSDKLSILLAVCGIVLALFIYTSNSTASRAKHNQFVDVGTKQVSGSKEVSTGTVTNIDYYHCVGNERHMVLLHGARFTKEDWKTSGILESFCKVPGLSVTAINLPVSASHEELQALLDAMQTAQLLTTPVTLVTPSASGKTITDWMMNGDVATLISYVSKWIPIAAGSVASVADDQLTSLNNKLSIFAIYGSRDSMGKEVTERLASLAAADTLEIEGGHPCYMESPEDFVLAVLKNMGLDI